MIKTRLQLKSESAFGKPTILGVAKSLYNNEGGITAFYKDWVQV